MENNPDRQPSVVGAISCTLGVAAWAMYAGVIVLERCYGKPTGDSPEKHWVVLILVLWGMLAVGGMVSGIFGLVQPRHTRISPLLGVGVNLAMIGVMAVTT